MIALLLHATGATLRLAKPLADGTPVVVALDARGMVATRIGCPRTQWSEPQDSAAKLIGSRDVMASVIANDGRLVALEDLGPARYECVLLPETAK